MPPHGTHAEKQETHEELSPDIRHSAKDVFLTFTFSCIIVTIEWIPKLSKWGWGWRVVDF